MAKHDRFSPPVNGQADRTQAEDLRVLLNDPSLAALPACNPRNTWLRHDIPPATGTTARDDSRAALLALSSEMRAIIALTDYKLLRVPKMAAGLRWSEVYSQKLKL